MIEFIQANASWIVLGALFLLMMRMHGSGGGMGCCGGHQHGQQDREPDQSQRSLPEPRQEEKNVEKDREPVASGRRNHSGGCH